MIDRFIPGEVYTHRNFLDTKILVQTAGVYYGDKWFLKVIWFTKSGSMLAVDEFIVPINKLEDWSPC